MKWKILRQKYVTNNFDVEIRMSNYHTIDKSIKLINKFCKINDLKYNKIININFDYKLSALGEVTLNSSTLNAINIKINPDLFINTPENFGFYDDYGINATIIHEFSHLLDFRLFIRNSYKHNFKKTLNIINENCNQSKREEIAEILSMYIINPYLLNLILPDVYKFFKNELKIKSPTPCTEKAFIKLYNTWQEKAVIQDLEEQYRIIVKNNKVIRK